MFYREDPYPLHEQIADHRITQEVARELRAEREAEAALWDEVREPLEEACRMAGLSLTGNETPADLAVTLRDYISQQP